MAKKHVAVSLRKPPSPEKVDAFVSGAAAVKAAPPSETKREQAPEAPRAAEATPAASVETASGAATSAAPPEPPVAAPPELPVAAPPEPPVVASPEPQPVAPLLVGADGRGRRAVTIYLPELLAERLVLHCIEQDRDMSNVLGEVIEDHLKRRLGTGPVPAEGAAASHGAPRDAAAPPGASSRADPFRDVDPGDLQGRVERFLQVGRVLIALWRQRPWGG
jgi:hypothetical protein